jgi:exodeoxyribonuclease VII small subunit
MADISALIALLEEPVDQMSYEQALSQLEDIVAALESGEHTLDLSLRLYERGQLLAQLCAKMLDQADLRVQQLSGETRIDFTPTDS